MSNLVNRLLLLLRAHHLCNNVRVLNYDETLTGKVELKIRCRVGPAHQFQIWLHHESAFQDYAFQLFTDRPLLRWDNAPHYPDIATSPHHFHDAQNEIHESPLTGNVEDDLNVVLVAIEKWLAENEA